MERRKHYWNNHWGALARRDILVFEDGGVWWVEARSGGSEGRSRWYELPNEDKALDLTRDLMSPEPGAIDDWRELPSG